MPVTKPQTEKLFAIQPVSSVSSQKGVAGNELCACVCVCVCACVS